MLMCVTVLYFCICSNVPSELKRDNIQIAELPNWLLSKCSETALHMPLLTEGSLSLHLHCFSQPSSEISMCLMVTVSFKTLHKLLKGVAGVPERCGVEYPLDLVSLCVVGVVDVVYVLISE